MMSPGLEQAALDEHGRDRATAAIELRLDDRAFGVAERIGLEVEHLRLEEQTFEQRVEPRAGQRRDLELERVATHGFDLDVVLEELGPDPLRVRARLVHLVDRDEDRDARRLRVADRLDRLRHDAVIGRDHEHHHVGDLRPRARMAVKAAWPGVSMKVICCPEGVVIW
jgi:hypothetical protein